VKKVDVQQIRKKEIDKEIYWETLDKISSHYSLEYLLAMSWYY
jgi:hypothetical protein